MAVSCIPMLAVWALTPARQLHCEENLEFLNDVNAYRQLASTIYPQPQATLNSSEIINRGRRRSSVVAGLQVPTLDDPMSGSARTSVARVEYAFPPTANVVSFDSIEKMITSGVTVTPDQFDESGNPADHPFFVIPTNLSAAELRQVLVSIKASVGKIINTYLDANSPKEINVPSGIKKRLLAEIAATNFHPEIFRETYEHIYMVLRVQPFGKFLNSISKNAGTRASTTVPPLSLQRENLPMYLSGTKMSLYQVISNSFPPPFSNKDLWDFLKTEHCEENLEFINDFIAYRQLASPIFPNQAQLDSMTAANRGRSSTTTRASMVGQPTQLGGEEQGPPSVRASAVIATMASRMSIVPFDQIEEHARTGEATKAAQEAAAANESEGIATFYTIPAGMNSAQATRLLELIRGSLTRITEMYIGESSTKEINVPSIIRRRLKAELLAQNFHPDILKETYDHIYTVLRIQPFLKFLVHVAKSTGITHKLKHVCICVSSSPFVSLPIAENDGVEGGRLSETSMGVQRRPSRVDRNLDKIVEKESEHGEPALSVGRHLSVNAPAVGMSISQSGSPAIVGKITIRQVLANVLPAPHTNKDFWNFLKSEHCEENLDFLNEINAYRQLANVVFPTQPAFVAVSTTTESLARAKTMPARPSATSVSASPLSGEMRRLGEDSGTPTSARASEAGSAVSAAPRPEAVNFDELVAEVQKLKLGEPSTAQSMPGVTLQHDMSPADIEKKLETMRASVKNIVDTYISVKSPREVNLPSGVRKRFMAEYEAKNFHPDIFREAFEHILAVLRVQPFVKFLAFVAKNNKDAAATDVKEVPQNEQQAHSSPRMTRGVTTRG
nr:hypothetical protein HK105_001448 [Polyrhizophydium stewartii]